jgi:hypothetical protein
MPARLRRQIPALPTLPADWPTAEREEWEERAALHMESAGLGPGHAPEALAFAEWAVRRRYRERLEAEAAHAAGRAVRS